MQLTTRTVLKLARRINTEGSTAVLVDIDCPYRYSVRHLCLEMLGTGEAGSDAHWVQTLANDIADWEVKQHEFETREIDLPVFPEWALAPQSRGEDVVYLLSTSIGLYKIGHTTNLKGRLAHYKSMPFTCDYVCVINSDNAVALEADLLSRFESKRVPPKLEWFTLSDDDVAYIKSLAEAKHG